MADRRPILKTEIHALQAVLAGEHAALWGYGVLGPRLPDDERQVAYEAYDAHRRLRRRLQDLLVRRKAEPVAALAGYRLPFPVDDPDSARRLARHLEEGCASLYADLVAAARDGTLRTFAASELTACCTRRLAWQGSPTAFPGLAERS